MARDTPPQTGELADDVITVHWLPKSRDHPPRTFHVNTDTAIVQERRNIRSYGMLFYCKSIWSSRFCNDRLNSKRPSI